MKERITQSLKRTWDEINPEGNNPFIAPTAETMLWISYHGGDDEAASAYLAMNEEEQLRLIYEVFPTYYPK